MSTPLQNRLIPEMAEFRRQCHSLFLATLDEQGTPNVSYAPFVLLDDGYYILISEIARHTRNLQQSGRASMMLIEDEGQSREIFARRRLTFSVTAQVIERHEARWQSAINALAERQGERVNELINMADFILFRLQPEEGLYVKGFGQAFTVTALDGVDVVHLDEGHRQIETQTAV
ncbi:MAG: heme utilization protein HutZ [Enterobacteriaceae bacterium]